MPYINKSFIGQASLVKTAGSCPCFMDLDFISVHKHAKRELGQYLAILTSRLVNEIYLTIIPRGRVGYEMIDGQRGA